MPSRQNSSPSQGCLQRKTLAANGPVFRWQSSCLEPRVLLCRQQPLPVLPVAEKAGALGHDRSGAIIAPASSFALFSASPAMPMKIEEKEESARSEEHTSELQSLMRISYAVFCLQTKTNYHK